MNRQSLPTSFMLNNRPSTTMNIAVQFSVNINSFKIVKLWLHWCIEYCSSTFITFLSTSGNEPNFKGCSRTHAKNQIFSMTSNPISRPLLFSTVVSFNVSILLLVLRCQVYSIIVSQTDCFGEGKELFRIVGLVAVAIDEEYFHSAKYI